MKRRFYLIAAAAGLAAGFLVSLIVAWPFRSEREVRPEEIITKSMELVRNLQSAMSKQGRDLSWQPPRNARDPFRVPARPVNPVVPAVRPQPETPKPSLEMKPVRVSVLMQGGNGGRALVNDQLLTVGDSIYGWTVQSISATEGVVFNRGRETVLCSVGAEVLLPSYQP